MTLLDQDFAQRCEGIRRAAAGRPTRRFLGRTIRRTLTGGTDVTDYTDYTSGHDYRYVDWNRAARLDELVSRQYHGREDHDVYLLIDSNRGMQLADDGGISKFDYARRLVAAIGYVAMGIRDRVTVAGFGGESEAVTPRLHGTRAVGELWDFINGLVADGGPPDLIGAIERFAARGLPCGLVVVISDLLDPRGFDRAFDVLRGYGYELFIAHLLADSDVNPGDAGKVAFHDLQSGRRRRSLIDATDLQNYRNVFDEFCGEVDRYCRLHQIGMARIQTTVPVEEAVERMLRFGRTVL